jgi:hypothetical protein
MDAGTTSSTTFKVRVGAGASSTVATNSGDGQNAMHNGVMASSITITEIKA